MLSNYDGKAPQIGANTFIAKTAVVIGDVVIGERCGVWYGAVLRGDVNSIRIGHSTNVQDCAVVHVSTDRFRTEIGDQVTIGHSAVIHGCTIGHRVLIGMGAILLDGVTVGDECVIAAGSVLPPGKSYPSRSLIIGSPAVVKRPITEEELAWLPQSAEIYINLAHKHSLLTLRDNL